MSLEVLGDPDLTEAASRVEPEKSETGTSGSCRFGIVRDCGVRSRFRLSGGIRHDVGSGTQVGVADLFEVVQGRAYRGHGRQATPSIVIVLLHEPVHQRVQQSIIVLGQSSLRVEDLTNGFVFLAGAGAHRGDERVARDEVHLERQDSEEQVIVRMGLSPWMGFPFVAPSCVTQSRRMIQLQSHRVPILRPQLLH